MNTSHFSRLLLLTLLLGQPMTSLALESSTDFPPTAAPVKYIAPDPFSPGQLFAASDHELFRRESGMPWKNFGNIETGSDSIRQFLPQTPHSLFIITGRAVFRLDRSQNKLEKIFEHRTDSGPAVFSFGVWNLDNPIWAAGTSDGLFLSNDQGKTWSPSSLLPGQAPVTLAAAVEKKFFLVSNNTLYKAEYPDRAQPVFILPELHTPRDTFESSTDTPEDPSTTEEPFKPQLIQAGKDARHLWLSTENGIAESRDSGTHWRLLSASGLENSRVHALAYAEQTGLLFAGTGSGIYVYASRVHHWRVFSRSSQKNTDALAITTEKGEKLIAIAEGRIVEHLIQPEQLSGTRLWLVSPEKEKMFESLAFFEPTVREVHRAVIRFGNLSSKKIRRWQRDSRLRALLPSFSMGRAFSNHNTIDLDRGGTADPDRYIVGPDSRSRGSDMSLSWTLSNLVWDTAQTSIDTREKLMIEQRRDFLAEATRIYYERRRLQAEILRSDPEAQEVSLYFEKQIRLEELTAQLDALTGGWMSDRLENVSAEHPELRGLLRRSSPVASRT